MGGLWLTPVSHGRSAISRVTSDCGGTQRVRAIVDSGAVLTAIPLYIATDYPTLQDDTSGAIYRSATGAKILDRGQKRLLTRHDGLLKGIKGRSMDVKKMLISAYDLCETGHTVTFDLGPGGSCAENKAIGERTPFALNGRTWDLEFDIVAFADAQKALKSEPPVLCALERQARPGAPTP